MAQKNIHFISMGDGKLRMVTHLDFTEEMLDKLSIELQNIY